MHLSALSSKFNPVFLSILGKKNQNNLEYIVITCKTVRVILRQENADFSVWHGYSLNPNMND